MSLEEILGFITQLLNEQWIGAVAAAVTSVVAWFLGVWRERTRWDRKEFLERLNVSLNTFDNGTLQIRTILEDSLEDIFLSKSARSLLQKAAAKTTETDPVLPLKEENRWFVFNEVLNQISEKYSEGFIRAAISGKKNCEQFVIALTFERDGHLRTRKIRAMLIKRSTLLGIPEAKGMPKFESPTHETRWRTLKEIAKRYEQNKDEFITFEICV